MIKVLHITNAYPYQEVPEYGVFVKEQIASLPTDRISNSIVFINGRENGKKAYLMAIKEIRSLIKGVDVVHCHHAYSFIVAMLAGVVGKKPIVLSFLNDWTYEVKDLPSERLKTVICQLCVRLSSRIIFKSPVPAALKDSPKVVNLPNGVDSEFFIPQDKNSARTSLNLDLTAKYLLFVSSKNQYREQKRYDVFAKVLKRVQELKPHLKIAEFVMVGQPRHLIPSIFSACDVHVLTSDYEGSPNSVKESLSCGTPVVSRDVGNVQEMLDGVVGTIVVSKDENVEQLAQAVVQTLDTYIEPTTIRTSFLEKGITKDLIAEKLYEMYSDLALGNNK